MLYTLSSTKWILKFEEHLDKNQYKELFLKDYLQNLIPYLTECYNVDQKLIELFFLVNKSILGEIGIWDRSVLFPYENRSNIDIQKKSE